MRTTRLAITVLLAIIAVLTISLCVGRSQQSYRQGVSGPASKLQSDRQGMTTLTPKLQPDRRAWEHIAELARSIERVTPWQNREFTETEWDKLMSAAVELQNAHPDDAYAAFVLYMRLYADPSSDMEARFMAWSKPMLVLRIMFDLPSAESEITQLAGISFDLRGSSRHSLALPFDWSGHRPKLCAFPIYRGGGSFPDYQPHLEFAAFRDCCKHRDGLRALASSVGSSAE